VLFLTFAIKSCIALYLARLSYGEEEEECFYNNRFQEIRKNKTLFTKWQKPKAIRQR
ncbi:LOW QUALITY PROTEIN: hypothetical protein TorRG33x02_222850, partial [Trema orientale]